MLYFLLHKVNICFKQMNSHTNTAIVQVTILPEIKSNYSAYFDRYLKKYFISFSLKIAT